MSTSVIVDAVTVSLGYQLRLQEGQAGLLSEIRVDPDFLQLREISGDDSSEELLEHCVSDLILAGVVNLYVRHQLDDPTLHDHADVVVLLSQLQPPGGPVLRELYRASPESVVMAV